MEYYVLIGGTQQGPHTAQELHDKLNMREIGPDDLAWHEGLSDWQSLKTLLSPGLESNSSQTPPPLPYVKVTWLHKKKVMVPLVVISTLLFSPGA
ncbi:MAG: DUF4339 domain-containing protein, partial [Prosthecobacter sp.]|nr:DUF4339 domain-containing protein [Prosthecobacter sp.]